MGWALTAVVVAVVVVVLRKAYARLTMRKGCVPLRTTWLLWGLNFALTPSVWLKDVLRYNVPTVGVMLGWPLELTRMRAEAERRTGLRDWAPNETFPKLYGLVVARMNEAVHSPFGRLVAFDYLMRRLVTRLLVIDQMKKTPSRPELSAAPLFVVGLPRTGTTFLHRLLALDPASRFPRTYELLDPVPRKTVSRAKRIRYWQSKLDLIKKVIPQIEAIHEIGAEEAEECILGLSVEVPMLPPTFRHQIRMCVTDGFEGIDLRNAYALHKRQLEFIAAAQDAEEATAATEFSTEFSPDAHAPRRWVLKCPVHVPFVGDLAHSFPDALVVWTHRDPAQSLPSLGSMFRTFADMCESDPCDLAAIGREQLKFWSAAVARCDTALAPGGAAAGLRRAHVRFEDLLRDPITTVRAVYAQFGWEVSAEFEQAMLSYLARNAAQRDRVPRHLKKFHQYSLAEYGLSTEQLRSEMAPYYAEHIDTPN